MEPCPCGVATGLLVRLSTMFPRLEGELGPMGERYELFVAVLELVRVEALLPYFRGQVGRPEEDRAALARAFEAGVRVRRARLLIERLEVDGIAGCAAGAVPAGFRARRRFRGPFPPRAGHASRLHETLIARTMDGHRGAHLAGCDGDRGAGEGGAEAEGSEAEAAQASGHARERRGRRSRAGWNGN